MPEITGAGLIDLDGDRDRPRQTGAVGGRAGGGRAWGVVRQSRRGARVGGDAGFRIGHAPGDGHIAPVPAVRA